MQAARYLHSVGADLEAQRLNGSTPLLTAAERNHTAFVRILHGVGAHMNASDNDGCSAFHFAAFNQYWHLLRFLHHVEEDRVDEGCV